MRVTVLVATHFKLKLNERYDSTSQRKCVGSAIDSIAGFIFDLDVLLGADSMTLNCEGHNYCGSRAQEQARVSCDLPMASSTS
jgi:hypothetical protein